MDGIRPLKNCRIFGVITSPDKVWSGISCRKCVAPFSVRSVGTGRYAILMHEIKVKNIPLHFINGFKTE